MVSIKDKLIQFALRQYYQRFFILFLDFQIFIIL